MMARAGSKGPGHGGPRASDADREQAIDSLKAAFVHGRLGKDEFDLRAGLALTSQTRAGLAAVTADIPAGLSLAPPEPIRGPNQPPLPPGRVARAASVLYAGMWAALILSPLGHDSRLAFALAWTSTLVYLGTLLMTAAAVLESRHEKRSRRQLPPGLLRG